MIMMPNGSGGMTMIPTSSGSSTPVEDPKCPHCHKKLPGWTEPSEISFTTGFICTLVIVFLLVQGFGAFAGALNGTEGSSPNRECGKYFEKRWEYVVPSFQVSCRSMEWLRNNSDKENND